MAEVHRREWSQGNSGPPFGTNITFNPKWLSVAFVGDIYCSA